jgi:hypothetical protein
MVPWSVRHTARGTEHTDLIRIRGRIGEKPSRIRQYGRRLRYGAEPYSWHVKSHHQKREISQAVSWRQCHPTAGKDWSIIYAAGHVHVILHCMPSG